MHFHLGKVFISHTAADKPFVRRLAARLEKSQFHVWLDEHDLIAGDPLPESIGKALQAARVILVVVSKASVASKWLRYELNIATERMIKGECRVIPIVIENATLSRSKIARQRPRLNPPDCRLTRSQPFDTTKCITLPIQGIAPFLT